MSTHPIVHIELPANDPAEAARFYEEMFGWEMKHMPEFDYWTFTSEEQRGGGFNRVSEDSPSGFPVRGGETIIYVAVENIDESLAKAESLGAQVLKPGSDIPGVGAYAIFRDPTGNLIGLYKGMEQSS